MRILSILFLGIITFPCFSQQNNGINIGTQAKSTACSGTLFDAGGSTGPYSSNQRQVFTICPANPTGCIELEMKNYQLEPFQNGKGDRLNIYAGEGTQSELLAQFSGFSQGTPLKVQSAATCITVEFISDVSTVFDGFELGWKCNQSCNASSPSNPTVIPSLPFVRERLSTCQGAATVGAGPCADAPFLLGPDQVFRYNAPGGFCAGIDITGALPGTGVAVFLGDPNLPSSKCIAKSPTGKLPTVDFQTAGTYYIVVANGNACTPFNIEIEQSSCAASSALSDALCNPVNGCQKPGGVPTRLLFKDGNADIRISDANNGCWLTEAAPADNIWFTVQAQADGKLGFLLNSGDGVSDIDFNVWGPFTPAQVCQNSLQVIQTIQNTQPVRSSFAPSQGGRTGLTDKHPAFGYAITDTYDCSGIASRNGDSYVSTISAKQGEVYVVLLNDYANTLAQGGIQIDWSPSNADVIQPLEPQIVAGLDTSICAGQAVSLAVSGGIKDIRWEGNGLSCTNCLNPTARPARTETYTAFINGMCTRDTLKTTVQVYTLDLGADKQLCIGNTFQLDAGQWFGSNTKYRWEVPSFLLVLQNCNNCPNPVFRASGTGTGFIKGYITTETCTLVDSIRVTVVNGTAPAIAVADNAGVCTGEPIQIGGTQVPNVIYTWSSVPAGFTSNQANPQVRPTQTTTYYLNATSGNCPFPSRDSVTVSVSGVPVLGVIPSRTICQGDTLVLATSQPQAGVSYRWTGVDTILNEENLRTRVIPRTSGALTYSVEADNNGCTATANVSLNVTANAVEILRPADTVRVCLGDTLILQTRTNPASTSVSWRADDGTTFTGASLNLKPLKTQGYTASISNGACRASDRIVVAMDSLPRDIALAPLDTMVCQGSIVIIESKNYEPSRHSIINFKWTPEVGQLSPDSLYNLVVQPDTTTLYVRESTHGACRQLDSARVEVVIPPVLTILPTDTLCPGQTVELRITNPEADSLKEVKWEPQGQAIAIPPKNITARGTFQATTTVSVSAMYRGCPAMGSANIPVKQQPVLNVIPNKTICLGQPTGVLNVAFSEATRYTWTSPDDPSFTSTAAQPNVIPQKTTTYRVKAEIPGCGMLEGSVTITVATPPTLTVPESVSVFLPPGQSTVDAELTATITGGSELGTQSFNWRVAGGTAITGQTVRIPVSEDSTVVTLTYTYGNGCILTDSTVIRVVKEPEIPNAFTPNGDGRNDFFRPVSAAPLNITSFRVFNRWGKMVYNNDTPATGWNGQVNNKPGPADVYVYIITIRFTDALEKTYRGDVTLLR